MLEITLLKKEFVEKLITFRKKHLDILDYVALVDLDNLIKEHDPEYLNPVQKQLKKSNNYDHWLFRND